MAANHLSRRDKLHLLDEHLIAIGYMTVRASIRAAQNRSSSSAHHGRQPSQTSPNRRPRSRRIASSRTATASPSGDASNSSYCSRRR